MRNIYLTSRQNKATQFNTILNSFSHYSQSNRGGKPPT